jgi:hypothetical protein
MASHRRRTETGESQSSDVTSSLMDSPDVTERAGGDDDNEQFR